MMNTKINFAGIEIKGSTTNIEIIPGKPIKKDRTINSINRSDATNKNRRLRR